MKHFKIFQEHSIFEKQDIETVIKPNISYCITENHIHFIHRVKPIYLKLAVTDNQGNLIPSLQINILDNNDNVVNTIISDDEAIILENLSVNTTYHLEYVNNIDTYLVPNNITFTIDANANITTSANTYKDGNYTVLQVELQKPRIKTLAVNAADGEQLETPPFIQLIDSEGNIIQEYENIEPYEIEELNANEEYTLRSTVAPEGFILSQDITFTIDEHGEVASTGNITTDEEGNTVLLIDFEMTHVSILCVDVANGEEVEGTHVQILDSEGNVVEEWDSTTEVHEIEGLKTGETYTLKTTVASDGFILATETTFTIDETGEVTSTGTMSEDGILLIEMQKTKVKISSVDVADGEELEGNHIQVLDSEGAVVEEWDSTTETHEIEGLKTGETYTLKTTIASEGYVLATETTFAIDETGEVTSTGTISEEGILLVEMQKTKVKVSCVDVGDGAELEGNHIQVLDSEGAVVEEWDSTDVAHQIEGLKTGEEYTLRNTVASEGYVLATDTTFTISDSGQVTSTGNTTTDEEGNTVLLVEMQITQVQISCTDLASGEELEGSTIQVIDSEGSVVEEWTSTTEAHEITGLKTGEEYTLSITVAPDGYTLTTDTTFTIDETGNVTSTGTISEDGILLVEIQMTHVEISCTDVASGEELEGSTIQVIDSEGNVVEEWVSTTEAHAIEGLKTGEEYTLRTTIASDGFILPTDTTFSIDNTGHITSTGTISEDGILLVEMTKTQVQVLCVDIASGEELEGSHIQVLDSEGNIVEEWDSTTEPHTIEGLNVDETYTLRNTVASEGYKLTSDTTFSINEDGEIDTSITTTTISEDGILLVEMEIADIEIIKVSCVDIGSGEELEGSTIQVLNYDENAGDVHIVDEWDSTTEPHQIEGLNIGNEYTLHNTVTSEGYKVALDTTFSIDETGQLIYNGSTTEDENGNTVILIELEKTQVQVSCVDIANSEELEGSHIQVIDPDGNVVEEWDSTDVAHQIEGLKTGIEYTLRNTIASDGFILPTDTTFSIDETGRVTSTGNTTTDEEGNTVLLVELVKTIVKISCVDIKNGDEVEGATIQVIDSEGNMVEEWTSTTEPHTIEGLKTGETYTLRTSFVPDEYLPTTETTFTIDETGRVTGTTTTTAGEDGNTVLLVELSKTINN